jgi:hypothetical protein
MAGQYAVASCHVELPLDDDVWAAFARFQARRPGGFRIAALLRPPDPEAGEDEAKWLERALVAQEQGPLGHHTHFGGVSQARPLGGEEPAGRVRREVEWLRERGLSPRLYCGGGWYMDEDVAAVLADHGYADCSATAFQPSYLPPGAPRLSLAEPSWLHVRGRRLLELPSTHSLGMAARRAFRPLPRDLHVYFHDTDLVVPRRRRALFATLVALGNRRRATDLETLADQVADYAPDVEFSAICAP